jgi:transposase-like protein
METNVRTLEHCPACQSRDLVTAAKKIDAETYWRCVTCGEVWNIKRLEVGNRNAYRRPYSNR